MTDDLSPIHVLNGRVALKQPLGGLRTSIDAVLLAASCPVQSGEAILDLGCGTGSAGLCVLARIGGTTLHGIDTEAEHIALAQENAQINGWGDSCTFEIRDVCDFGKSGAAPAFDQVICNPPFLGAGSFTPSPSAPRAKAIGHEAEASTLGDWIACAHRSVKPGGYLTMIHRADQIDDILQAMAKRFGAVEIFPLWPKEGREAKRVILRARRDRKDPARVLPGLILHDDSGNYTPQAQKVLREAQHLF